MAFQKSRRRQAKDTKIGILSQWHDGKFEGLRTNRQTLIDFENSFFGKIVYRGDPDYEKARRVDNPAFQDYPAIIAYCETFSDVRSCLGLARASGLWAVCRSGGHSTAGFSINTDGMVIDLSRINHVWVDPDRQLAVVGAGANFGKLNAILEIYKLHVPGGGCEDVCIGGYMQGGGYGFTSREFGMNCDNVMSVLVMLADGKIVHASPFKNSDLFWAVRGGTGNNFGVLLEVRYQLHHLPQVWGFGIQWDLSDGDAARALQTMQGQYMSTGAPSLSRLGYMAFLVTAPTPQNKRVLLMRGMYDGPAAEGKRLIDPLLSTGHARLEIEMTGPYYQTNRSLLEKPYSIPPIPDEVIAMEDKQAGYIEQSRQVSWGDVIDYYATSPSPYNIVVIEPYGGAINRYPASHSAFIHRRPAMDFFVDTFWTNESQRPGAVAWLDGFMHLMEPNFNGHVYQNYPRRGLENYRWMYWGEAFSTLLRIKQKYDPDCFFHFDQSITPIPPDADRGITRITSEPMFNVDPSIEYESY